MEREINPLDRIVKLFALLTLTAFLIMGAVFYFLYQGESNGEVRDVLIPRKTTLTSVSELLYKNDIISNPQIFKILLRFSGGNKKVRAGEFKFRTKMNAMSALSVLYYEEAIVHSITIPEGTAIKQMVEILMKEGLIDPERFINYAMNPDTAKKYKINAPSLEGYLFPDTYAFSKIDREEKIIDHMVQRFFQRFDASLQKAAKDAGWRMEEVVTFASIIEKETGNPEERKIISSVFHNRLKKRMRLQSDPTTIYGIADFNGNITKKDLQTPTPYNTYTIFGLPPGPIASPGIEALRAVLYPAKTDYLYFVSSNNGSHFFSKSYKDHSSFVNTYQKKNNRKLTRAK